MRSWLLPLALISSLAISQGARRDLPSTIFTSVGLTPQQVGAIETGHAVAKVLSWGGPSEVYVFGAVHVDGTSDAYLKLARDVGRLKGTSGYLGVGELTDRSTVADLQALTLEPDDLKALKNCHEGSCNVQLPSATIQSFHDAVDWTRADAADQANSLARSLVLELLRTYRQGGNKSLGEYRDKQEPARIAEQFETMVGRTSVLPDVMPELRRYLLDYPKAELEGADSFFYWEKVAFGLKPTIRVNHAVVYRSHVENRDVATVAIKQLYASHYFHTALDLSVCVNDEASHDPRGFYLLTLKGSQQEGLSGVKGSTLRHVVVDKTRSSLENALTSIKHAIEHP